MAPVVLPVDSGVESPPLHAEERLLPETVAWWETVWSSPMASQYLSCDVPTLERLAVLVDRMNRGEAGSRLLGEIRALEDRFGLSPMARLRLQWELPVVPAGATWADGADDDARWLRVVDSD